MGITDRLRSLGSKEMMKALRGEGFEIGRYRTRRPVRQMGLKLVQRVAYKVTTKRKQGTPWRIIC